MGKIRSRTCILLVLFNIYLITSLFFGKNTIFNFVSYKKKNTELSQERLGLIKQRYNLEQIHVLLQNNNSDSDDVLDELLRSITQSSLPGEKIVILD